MPAFADGNVAKMDNFKRTEIWRGGKCSKARSASIDKGQKQEIHAFVDAVKSGGEMPVSLDSLFATTAASFAVSRSVTTRSLEKVSAWESWVEPRDDDGDEILSEAGAAQ